MKNYLYSFLTVAIFILACGNQKKDVPSYVFEEDRQNSARIDTVFFREMEKNHILSSLYYKIILSTSINGEKIYACLDSGCPRTAVKRGVYEKVFRDASPVTDQDDSRMLRAVKMELQMDSYVLQIDTTVILSESVLSEKSDIIISALVIKCI